MGQLTLHPFQHLHQNNMIKTLLNFAILTTIVIAVWVFVSVFHSFTSTTISDKVADQIKPISPSFDISAISNLRKRTFIPTDLSGDSPNTSGSALLSTENPEGDPTEDLGNSLNDSSSPNATNSSIFDPANL